MSCRYDKAQSSKRPIAAIDGDPTRSEVTFVAIRRAPRIFTKI
jgi:hypothetical protein